ncbi:MAG TPA: universal stress protein [Hymenobacter sp.]|jgi:nucleotide-binding universal stress UspA family protein
MAPSLLILTDFFQAAAGAFQYAVNLAAPMGARLVLLHVRRDSALDPERFTGALQDLNAQAMELTFNSLSHELSVPMVAEVGHGRVADAVADAVSRHRPTVMVLGRTDPGETPDELVTATSLDLLRTAPYPMLVVPHFVQPTHPPRRVLIAVDGAPFTLGEPSLAVRRLLSALKAELTVLQVSEQPLPDGALATALDSVLLAGLVQEAPQPIRTRNVTAEHPAEGILQAAASAEFDMVLVVARRRSFWGQLFHRSVTAQVLLRCAFPVLVLPAQE